MFQQGRSFFEESIDMKNMFLNTNTKPGAIRTLHQNHNHKYLLSKRYKGHISLS